MDGVCILRVTTGTVWGGAELCNRCKLSKSVGVVEEYLTREVCLGLLSAWRKGAGESERGRCAVDDPCRLVGTIAPFACLFPVDEASPVLGG